MNIYVYVQNNNQRVIMKALKGQSACSQLKLAVSSLQSICFITVYLVVMHTRLSESLFNILCGDAHYNLFSVNDIYQLRTAVQCVGATTKIKLYALLDLLCC